MGFSSIIRSFGALTVALSLAACGTSNDTDGKMPTPKADPCAAADISDCLINQQSCSMASGSASCQSCDVGHYAAESGDCEAIPGQAMTHAFPEQTTTPGQEVLGLCRSWTLGNETELWVNTVELAQNEASHHSNWLFVPETKYAGDDGIWTCSDRGFDELSAAVAGGVLYAQSTQAKHEVQKFASGAAVRIPPHAKIVSDIHLLNVSDTSISGHVDLTLYTLDASTIEHKLTPFRMNYGTLDIPPLATSRFTGECPLADSYQTAVNKPWDAKLYYALPHTHQLGSRFFLEVMGGAMDGQALIDLDGFNGEARGRSYDPPVDLSGSNGLRFGCEFQNPRNETVHWGFGDQEMCEMLGFIEASAGFDAEIATDNANGNDGATMTFTGPCQSIMLPWDAKQ